MADGITPLGEAFLAASQLREATEDLSPADINRLPMADYSKIRERAGLPAIDPFSEVYESNSAPPGRPRQDDPGQRAPAQEQGTDFSQISMSEYAEIRSNFIRPSSGTGRGLFN